MKILVTGGAGFIGSHVAHAFIHAGHSVSIVDNLCSGKFENIHPNAKFFDVDLCDSSLARVIAEVAPDIISHHAAQVSVRKSVDNPIFDAEVNILGSLNLLEAARKLNINRIIFSSTGGAIYGEQEYFPADETHPLNPCSPYGIAKLSVEKYLNYYHKIYGMRTTILRYANVYGPRQDSDGEAGVVAIFCKRLLNGQPLVINGDGLQTRDYIYVDDVVKANLLVLNDPASEIYNVGTGIETTVNNLFDELCSSRKINAEKTYMPAKLGEQKRSVLSVSKLSQRLGWNPEINLEQGLRKTFESFSIKKV